MKGRAIDITVNILTVTKARRTAVDQVAQPLAPALGRPMKNSCMSCSLHGRAQIWQTLTGVSEIKAFEYYNETLGTRSNLNTPASLKLTSNQPHSLFRQLSFQ